VVSDWLITLNEERSSVNVAAGHSTFNDHG